MAVTVFDLKEIAYHFENSNHKYIITGIKAINYKL